MASQMKAPIHFSSLIAPLCIACAAFLPAGMNGQDKVVIHGRVLIDEDTPMGTFEVVEVGNWFCVPLAVEQDGEFDLRLTVGDLAYLRFEQEGYLTKEVLVDTRNANLTKQSAKRNKHLRFDVQMTPVLPDKHMVYRGPVGIITYLKGTGLMKVKYDRSLVRLDDGFIVENTAVH